MQTKPTTYFSSKSKQLAVLVDPDKASVEHLQQVASLGEKYGVDFFFVGGSLLVEGSLNRTIREMRKHTSKPLILFPGSAQQVDQEADAILLLSLISGRNPELLIGQHVQSSMRLHQSGLDILPTGYILIDGGRPTTASYISGTQPIPGDKPEISGVTALAGCQLGLQNIYLDTGSGAASPVQEAHIKAVRKLVDVPIICGGGMSTPEQVQRAHEAGANVVVIGNAIEQDPSLIASLVGVTNGFVTR